MDNSKVERESEVKPAGNELFEMNNFVCLASRVFLIWNWAAMILAKCAKVLQSGFGMR